MVLLGTNIVLDRVNSQFPPFSNFMLLTRIFSITMLAVQLISSFPLVDWSIMEKELENDTVQDMVHLPDAFAPSSLDVVVGTGREAKLHPGNGHFLELLQREYLEKYSNAKCKLEKTLIISEIVNDVRERSPTHTGFVKRIQDCWCQVEDHLAREKVSQSLRNILHTQYRSSVKSKKQRRCMIRQEIDNSVDDMLNASQSFLSLRISELSLEMDKKGGAKAPDAEVLRLFSQANIDILEGLKKDKTVRRQIQMSCQQQQPEGATGTPPPSI